jgi:hypothetical protein
MKSREKSMGNAIIDFLLWVVDRRIVIGVDRAFAQLVAYFVPNGEAKL